MVLKKRVLLSWSSGKDSAWALGFLRQQPDIEVAALMTTFNTTAGRVAMHAVRRTLVETQAARAGIPLWQVELPSPCSNTEYEEHMRTVCQRALAEGITAVAFGDLFLEDIRAYRERQLHETGLTPLFPCWRIPTTELAEDMIKSGVRAKITCVDPRQIASTFAGRDFDPALLKELPASADPCGENGEFHTFVHASPVFSQPVAVVPGAVVERDGFVFADVLPA